VTNKTIDEIGGRGLVVVQSVKGVKVSVDSLLLADFCRVEPGWKVADLGCGNGLVGMTLAADNMECTVLGVEIQRTLISHAAEGAQLNNLSNISFICGDLRSFPWRKDCERFDLVVANPPYRQVGTGRISPDPARAIARHELLGNAHDFAQAASTLLRSGGRSSWIYLNERLEDLLEAILDNQMEPVRLRKVCSREDDTPSLVLVEAIKGAGSRGNLTEEPTLVLYRGTEGRDYTDEARRILYGS
jgi:tRNA1Val (adenine37-N6)-methyltransferase